MSSSKPEPSHSKMGKPTRKPKKPKERWLLTRKTWRYMADAGKKLIPEGAQNRPEDVPKIEAHFQEMCKRESRFLLWRKNSYPGALGFRPTKVRKGLLRKGGSCRTSSELFEVLRPERPKDLVLLGTQKSRFDLRKMREEFLNKPYSPPDEEDVQSGDEKEFLYALENFLKISDKGHFQKSDHSTTNTFNYDELVEKLQRHLSLMTRSYSPSRTPSGGSRLPVVHFQGDHLQKSLAETLSRYFSAYPNRDKVISDLLTNRRALEKLYFDLRKAKGFRGRNRGGLTSWSSDTNIRDYSYSSKLPLIEIEEGTKSLGTQTQTIPHDVIKQLEEDYKKELKEREEEDRDLKQPSNRRKSSVDHDDVSQSVSDTIKRYLRMARKKSVDTDKADRFKRVNYDRNLRNIKAKGEITKPGDDDGLNKGTQTNENWITIYQNLKFDSLDSSLQSTSRTNSIDANTDAPYNPNYTNKSCQNSPQNVHSSGHSFLANLIHGKGNNDKSSSGGMQKSKSSSSVGYHGGKLVAKKIFKSRSKSQVRAAVAACSWTPQGGSVWTNVSGRRVVLEDTSLLQLSEIERQVVQKVALAKLQALNLGVAIKIPTETVANSSTKPKRKAYLPKRKALTTSIFDITRKDNEKEKDGVGSLVFGVPLTQCVEHDRLSRTSSATQSFGNRKSGSDEPTSPIKRHGSRASFSSLYEPQREDESDSCESTVSQKRTTGSIPGLLDSLSCGSTTELALEVEEDLAVPNIVNECIRHLETYGLHTLGIFRVSTSKKRIRQLREDFDSGKESTLDNEQCPHDVATLLKEYLRELPDPLLCRDLYHAFVQSQKVRNRKLQFEALQHLIQLLPPVNRDTLWVLLNFLSLVAKYSTDYKDSSGESIPGNKMDSNNLATVFAPNILHCVKPTSSKDASGERPEDHLDVINVVRTLIDHHQQLFNVPAEILDEVYVHLMDSYPDVLDQLLNKKDAMATADESLEELESDCNSAPWTPTLASAETPMANFYHNLVDGNQIQQKKTWSREECLHEAAATGGPNVAMRIRHKDRTRDHRSSKKHYNDSPHQKPLNDDKPHLTGLHSKTILSKLLPQHTEDPTARKPRSSSLESTSSTPTSDRRQSFNIITASLTIPVQSFPPDDDIPYIEHDSIQNSRQKSSRRRQRSTSGSDSSSVSVLQPLAGSISLATDTSSSPSWASTPPTSPDSAHTTVNYLPDVKSQAPSLQKVSFVSAPEVQQLKPIKTEDARRHNEVIGGGNKERERNFTPSITNIGNAVLRSKTADFERIAKIEVKSKPSSSDKKKYTKRRYTDSRHQTRHIPDAEALEAVSGGGQKKDGGSGGVQIGPVYKRREIISSVPSK